MPTRTRTHMGRHTSRNHQLGLQGGPSGHPHRLIWGGATGGGVQPALPPAALSGASQHPPRQASTLGLALLRGEGQSPTFSPTQGSGQETQERDREAVHGEVASEHTQPLPFPCSPLPFSSPSLCSVKQLPPPCWGTGVSSGKTPGAGLGASFPRIRVQGRRGLGEQGLRTQQRGRPRLPNPLHPHVPTSTLEAPGMEEGGQRAWRTGHPLGRTQDARPEVPSPSQGHRGKGHWGLGLTRSEADRGPESQLLGTLTSRTAEPAPTKHLSP